MGPLWQRITSICQSKHSTKICNAKKGVGRGDGRARESADEDERGKSRHEKGINSGRVMSTARAYLICTN